MSAIDKHLISFTGADRHNDNFVISGKPKGGTSRFETYAAMQIVTEEQLHAIAGRTRHKGYNLNASYKTLNFSFVTMSRKLCSFFWFDMLTG